MQALERYDELFLADDRGKTVGHIGALLPFDAAHATAAPTVDDLRELVERRLERLPILRRRPEPDPSRPGLHRWIEDEAVDLGGHIHGHKLDGGDDRALGRLAAELNASALEHSRPLWQLHVIEGLQGGRVAVLLKFHHALGDAVPSRFVLDTLFGVGEEAPTASPAVRPRHQAPEATSTPSGPRPIPPLTRFNKPLSGERDFAFAPFARERVERIRSASATTFTDVLVAAWAGALRGWLTMRGEAPTVPLVARVPISLRRPDDDAASGNRLVAMPVPVPADQGDARARLRSAHQAMTRSKQIMASGAWGGVGAGFWVNFSLSTYLGSRRRLAWRAAAGVGIYALAMMNVSGLAIACGTEADELWVGVHVDAEQVSDPWSLLRAFDLALADLETEVAA
jgi:hypothetical protein